MSDFIFHKLGVNDTISAIIRKHNEYACDVIELERLMREFVALNGEGVFESGEEVKIPLSCKIGKSVV